MGSGLTGSGLTGSSFSGLEQENDAKSIAEINIRTGNFFIFVLRKTQSGGTVPILLFNEADAIFGIRQSGAERAVDKMENSIQNIILQEMEDLDGILIATTNLTANLDKAFERRFLYKVRFNKPSLEAKVSIWKAMMGELSDKEAIQLANDYDFSGGQIENVSRKKTIRSIIDCAEPSFMEIKKFCDEENMGERPVRKPIGF